jgi:hypothetical protein
MSGKRNIFLTSGLAIIAVAAVAYLLRSPSPASAALAARQHAMEMLGLRIAKLQPECKVLLLSNPFTKEAGYLNEKSQYERAGLRGLRKGLGGRSPVEVVFPQIRPEYFANPQSIIIPPDSRTPLSFLIQPASVDQLAEAHPACRVIVSLIGLPAEVEQLKIWNEKDPRCFALLLPDLRLLGPPAAAVEAFQRGKLLAAVVKDFQSGEPLIVTRDNIVEVLKLQPKSLGY